MQTHAHTIIYVLVAFSLQLSVLRLFEAILSDLAIMRNPDFAELITFARGTVRSMFAR